jgi:hypothetical protein
MFTVGPSTNTSSGGFKDWWQDNKSGIGSLFGNLIKGGADYAAADDIIKRLTEVGSGLAEGFTDLGQEAFSRSQFKPFTVTTGAGTTKATVDPETGEYSGYSTTLGTPEEQRQQQLLNDRLLSQGRLGLTTSMYGGSPEQFAMEKARAEAMNQASLAAMERAGQERQQDLATATGLFGLGGQAAQLPLSLQGVQGQNLAQMMGLQFMPEQQMLDALGAGTNLASIADEGRRYGAGLFDESTGSGLEAILQAELGKADFLKSLYSGAVGQGGGSSGGGGWFDTIIDTIFGS